MTQAIATTPTRRAKPSHAPWMPHNYQQRGVEFLMSHNAAALFWDPGLGKSSTTLEAFRRLKEQSLARRMLIVAPLRVCQLVWAQEGRKWTQFRDLTFSLLHGPKKDATLKDDAHIHIVNPEGIQWLIEQFWKRPLPYDTVVIDELTKFKNHRALRSKALRTKLHAVRRRWGLTGTPIPNGYMDLFGQMLMLDDGLALGKFITHFRDKFFVAGFNGFDYALRPGADKEIETKIAPYVLRASGKDYLELPPLTTVRIPVALDAKSRKLYERMKADMLVSLPGGMVTAQNAAGVYSKLKQMANGAVYVGDEMPGRPREVAYIHAAKLDALEELIEEMSGQPLMVAYEFRHDLERLRERFGKTTPYLGSGVTHTEISKIVDAWNAGNVPLLLIHPGSAGHGLNLQSSGASHICWFSPTWDYELYDQTIRRIHRQGSTAPRIVNHVMVATDTVDELVIEALDDKETTQGRLLDALNTEIIGGRAAADFAVFEDEGEVKMITKLDTPRKIVPKGWGEPEPTEDTPAPETTHAAGDQRELIRNRLRGLMNDDTQPASESRSAVAEPAEEPEDEPASVKARRLFSKAIRDKLENGIEEPANTASADVASTGESAPRKRTTRAKPVAVTGSDTQAPAASATPRVTLAVDIDYERFGREVAAFALSVLAKSITER